MAAEMNSLGETLTISAGKAHDVSRGMEGRFVVFLMVL